MILLPSARARLATVPFLFRAHDCLDDTGLFALSYGQKVYATFARTGPAFVTDQRGLLLPVPQHMPRVSRLTAGATRVPALLLEGPATNLLTYSEQFSSWSNGGAGAGNTSDTRAPNDTETADLIDATSSAADSRYLACTFSGTARKSISIYLKAGSAARTGFAVYDNTDTVFRHYVRITWSGGVPTATSLSGTGVVFPVESVGNGWYRIGANVGGIVPANDNRVYLYPDDQDGVGSVYAWGAQAEEGGAPTSYEPTSGGTALREAESLSFPFLMPPQALSVYYAGIEVGLRTAAQTASDSYHLWTLTSAAAANPKLRMNCFAGNGRYQFQHTDASGSHSTSSPSTDAPQPDHLEAFEVRGVLDSSGRTTCGVKSASDAAETLGAAGVTLALPSATWGGQLLYLNQNGSAGAQRFASATRALCLAPGALSMDALRDLCELG